MVMRVHVDPAEFGYDPEFYGLADGNFGAEEVAEMQLQTTKKRAKDTHRAKKAHGQPTPKPKKLSSGGLRKGTRLL